MKVAPVSGDLLVKLALLAAGLGAVWWAVSRARDGLSALPAAAADWAANVALTTLNPASEKNAAYTAANAATAAATGGRETSFGAWLRDVTSNDDERVRAMLEGRPIPPSNVNPAGMY